MHSITDNEENEWAITPKGLEAALNLRQAILELDTNAPIPWDDLAAIADLTPKENDPFTSEDYVKGFLAVVRDSGLWADIEKVSQ